MSNFSLQRMARFARWTIVTDMPYHRKNLALYIGITTLVMQIQNLAYILGGHKSESEGMLVGVVVAMLGACIIVGSGYMFQSFHFRKDGIRDMFMAPASNLEKFLVRYLLPMLINFLLCLVALLLADALQYLVGMIIQREGLCSVFAQTYELLSAPVSGSVSTSKGWFLIFLAIWVHTFFLLGVNFFRSFKYGWSFTAIILLAVFIMYANIAPWKHAAPPSNIRSAADALLVVLSVLQVWLAYRLFCRRQLIGRFVNW